jgi:hypothetical protein
MVWKKKLSTTVTDFVMTMVMGTPSVYDFDEYAFA